MLQRSQAICQHETDMLDLRGLQCCKRQLKQLKWCSFMNRMRWFSVDSLLQTTVQECANW
eukprot:6155331-Prorocentrum_lima.AAC.1